MIALQRAGATMLLCAAVWAIWLTVPDALPVPALREFPVLLPVAMTCIGLSAADWLLARWRRP